jgi:chromosome segregation ATPase
LEHRTLKLSFQNQQEELKTKEAEHKRALEEEKSEVSRLQQELDRVGKERSELKKERDALKKTLADRAANDQKIKTRISEVESAATHAKDELDALNAKVAKWLAEMRKLNEELDSKFPESPPFLFYIFPS